MLDIIKEGLWGTAASVYFTCIITSIFLFSMMIMLSRKEEKFQFIVEHSPGILTMLGLFGTFWGVAQGLGSFNVQDIDKSVPELLSGMKLAFWTSILGMFFALCLNVIKFISGVFKHEKTEGSISASDIYKIMSEQNKNLNELKQAIGGDGDYSLVTQIRLFKSEAKDQNDLLIKEFLDFANKVADNNSKALIDALKEVIRDFNAKINEQFGENFKELNHAVNSLLQWQENYKTHIEALTAQFSLAIEGIERSRAAIEEICQNTNSIPQTMEILRNLFNQMNQEIGKAEELLEGFTALRNKADEVFPTIKQGLESLTHDLAGSITASTHEVESIVTSQSRALGDLAKRISDIAINTDNVMREGLGEIRGTFQKVLSDVEESTKKSFNMLDTQMEKELQKAIRILGSQLASVAAKLIEDYETLGTKISGLVHVAEGRTSSQKDG